MTEELKPSYDMSIHTNPDAMAWAKFYKETHPDCDLDEMLGWFANAMMAMHDHLKKKFSPTRDEVIQGELADKVESFVNSFSSVSPEGFQYMSIEDYRQFLNRINELRSLKQS